jgi:hypothetical protein
MRWSLLFALAVAGCSSGESPAESPASETSIEDVAVTDTDEGEDVPDAAPPPPSCTNGTRDGAETDVDCGGPCAKCAFGRTCLAPADCKSGSCADALCACAALDDCPSGQSCVAGSCVAAVASCAATKTAYPTAKDGEYWIKPATGASYRAYCDMARVAEICNEAGTTVSGRTREGSLRTWTGKGKLLHEAGVCELWALAGPSGYPFDKLNLVLGQTLTTCQAFGFVADGTLGSCAYGSSRTNCGFAVATLYRFGNVCSGCTLGAGSFRNYTQQGPMSAASVLSNTSGTIKTTCKVR